MMGDTVTQTGVMKTTITDLGTGDLIDLGFLEKSGADLYSGNLSTSLNGLVSYSSGNTIVSLNGLTASSSEGAINSNLALSASHTSDQGTDTNSTLSASSTLVVNATISSKVSSAIVAGIDTADTALHNNTSLNITSHDLISNFPALSDVYHV